MKWKMGLQMKKKYDVFLSYRRFDNYGRTSGRDIARTIKLELEKRGYNVFFDYSEIKDDEFENTILPAIISSKYFILVLTENALDRCVNDKDWVRREISTAISSGCKIIPIIPDNQFGRWPSLSEDIVSIKNIQISEVSMSSLFEKSIDKLIEDRFEGNNIRKIIYAVISILTILLLGGIFFYIVHGDFNKAENINNIPVQPDSLVVNDSISYQDNNSKKILIDIVEPYISNGKVGLRYINSRENVVECKYDYIGSFINEMAQVKLNGKYGFINSTGKLAIEPQYDSAVNFVGELCPVGNKYKYGYIDKNGTIIIPLKYSSASIFNKAGVAAVREDINNQRQYKLIDLRGNRIWGPTDEPIFSTYKIYGEGDDGDFGFTCGAAYLNSKGQFVSKEFFKKGQNNDFHRYENNGQYGIVDNNNKILVSCKYKDVNICEDDGFIYFRGEKKYQKSGRLYDMFDSNGKMIISDVIAPTNLPPSFSEGLALVETIDSKRMFINHDGSVAADHYIVHRGTDTYEYPISKRSYNFSEGLAFVSGGFINKDFELVIPQRYDNTTIGFRSGLAEVYIHGSKYEEGYVDKYGHDTFGN